jgi:propanol-preferring alcohol dehydrogenase
MKAMVCESTAPIDSSPLCCRELPTPTPRGDEVRVRISCCGICRTDLHVIEGDLPAQKRPIIPGHQAVGVVDAIGETCRRLRVGMRVGIPWLRYTCGQCHYCLSGRENLCPDSRYTGYHADGGFAEFAVISENFAYKLPAEYSDLETAPLLCAGIIGYRAFCRCNLHDRARLGLFGFGSSAHMVLQLARHRGHEVYVITRSKLHQDLAAEMGAAWCGDDATLLPKRLQGAIVFAPAGEIVPIALAAVEPGSTVALAGIHMSPIPSLDYKAHLYGERDLHSVMANTRQDGRYLFCEATRSVVRPRYVTYPLCEANRALQDLKHDRIEGTAVLTID